MTSDKILILDDKAYCEDFSTSQLLSKLMEIERNCIDYHDNAQSLWSECSNGDDIILLKDFSNFPFVLIHDSFENPLVQDGLRAVLFEKLSITSKVILFSGSISESEIPLEKIYDEHISGHTLCFEILRRQYFNNLEKFIASYLLTGKYQIKYLYNQYLNPKKDKAYTLLKNIQSNLEESIYCAVESNSFSELLSLYGYTSISEIKVRFSTMSDDDFIENLEDLIENN